MGIPFDKVERVQWRVDDGEINECDFRIVNGIKYVPERVCKRVRTKYREKRCQIEWECGRCGFPLYSDHDSFCSECGAKVG